MDSIQKSTSTNPYTPLHPFNHTLPPEITTKIFEHAVGGLLRTSPVAQTLIPSWRLTSCAFNAYLTPLLYSSFTYQSDPNTIRTLWSMLYYAYTDSETASSVRQLTITTSKSISDNHTPPALRHIKLLSDTLPTALPPLLSQCLNIRSLSLFLKARPMSNIDAEKAFYEARWPALEGLGRTLESFTFSSAPYTFKDVPFSEIVYPGCFSLMGSTALVSLRVPAALLYGKGCRHVTPRRMGSHIPLTLRKLKPSHATRDDLNWLCNLSRVDWEMEFVGMVRATGGGKGFGRARRDSKRVTVWDCWWWDVPDSLAVREAAGRGIEWVRRNEDDYLWCLEEMDGIGSTVIRGKLLEYMGY
ncbi:hypothetical protein BDW69DRAFT_181669 [Aspergillus filifer]